MFGSRRYGGKLKVDLSGIFGSWECWKDLSCGDQLDQLDQSDLLDQSDQL